jgi:hypothetical protein
MEFMETAAPAVESSAATESEFSFFRNDDKSQFLANRDNADAMLQWNLDNWCDFKRVDCLMGRNPCVFPCVFIFSTKIEKYRFTGVFSKVSTDDYERVLREFFCSPAVLAPLGIAGSASVPVQIEHTSLGLSVMSMDFFDKLSETGIFVHLL